MGRRKVCKIFSSSRQGRIIAIIILPILVNVIYLCQWMDYSDGSNFMDENQSLLDIVTHADANTIASAPVLASLSNSHHLGSIKHPRRGLYFSTNVPNESSIFQEIKVRAMKTLRLCEDMAKATNKTVTSTEDQNNPLKPFGFIDDVGAYLAQKRLEKQDKHSPNHVDQCYLPPLQVCATNTSSTFGYSVIVTYKPSTHVDTTKPAPLRVLFMNTMSLIMYSDVNEIIIIYHGFIDELRDDSKYGKRLLAWSDDNDHPVQMIIESEVNAELATIFSHPLFRYHPNVLRYAKQDILLFLDGTQSLVVDGGKLGGEGSLSAGFELAKNNSRTLVGQEFIEWPTRYWKYDRNSSTTDEDQTTQGDEQSARIQRRREAERALQERNPNQRLRYLSSNSSSNESQHNSLKSPDFIPYCYESQYVSTLRGTRSRNTTTSTMPSLPSVVGTSGFFLHRNYLCFIWHTIFTPLREFLASIEFQEKTTDPEAIEDEFTLGSVAVSMLIGQLSSSMPALYPLIKQSWKNVEHLDSNKAEEQAHDPRRSLLLDSNGATSVYADHRRRRRTWDLPETTDYSQNITTIVHRRLKSLHGVGGERVKVSPNISPLKRESIMHIIAYFGSVLPG